MGNFGDTILDYGVSLLREIPLESIIKYGVPRIYTEFHPEFQNNRTAVMVNMGYMGRVWSASVTRWVITSHWFAYRLWRIAEIRS